MDKSSKQDSSSQSASPSVARQSDIVTVADILEQLHHDLRETFVLLRSNNDSFSPEQVNAAFGENPQALHELVRLVHLGVSSK